MNEFRDGERERYGSDHRADHPANHPRLERVNIRPHFVDLRFGGKVRHYGFDRTHIQARFANERLDYTQPPQN